MDLLASSLGSEVPVNHPVSEEFAGHVEAVLALILVANDRSASHTNGIGSTLAAVLLDDALQHACGSLAQRAREEVTNYGKISLRNFAEIEISIPVVVAFIFENIVVVVVVVVSVLNLHLFVVFAVVVILREGFHLGRE